MLFYCWTTVVDGGQYWNNIACLQQKEGFIGGRLSPVLWSLCVVPMQMQPTPLRATCRAHQSWQPRRLRSQKFGRGAARGIPWPGLLAGWAVVPLCMNAVCVSPRCHVCDGGILPPPTHCITYLYNSVILLNKGLRAAIQNNTGPLPAPSTTLLLF